MTTLYVAWQHPASRRWFPVGRLVRHKSSTEEFEFAYVHGAKDAERLAGFRRIPGFPDLEQRYHASELFPTFRNRIMNTSRIDRPDYLHQLGLDEAKCDELAELSVSGGQSHTDSFEIFPGIEPDADGRFSTPLTVHGLRHRNPEAIAAVQKLRAGDRLQVAIELNNPVTKLGILVCSQDYYILGWLPRFISEGILQCTDWASLEPEVVVAQVNQHAPLSQRLLVDFTGWLGPGATPMQDLEQYQPIVGPRAHHQTK